MVEITEEIKHGLDCALNEATIFGLEFIKDKKSVYVTFYPIALQSDGTIPKDNRVLFAFRNVGRLASSHTLDRNSLALPFDPSEITDKFKRMRSELYGWEFIDNGEKIYQNWQSNKSFDLIMDDDFNKQHTIDLFQENIQTDESIDLRIWFDYIEILDSNLNEISMQTFIENGKRAWSRMYESGWTTTFEELQGMPIYWS